MNRPIATERRRQRRVSLSGTTTVRIIAPSQKQNGRAGVKIAEGHLHDLNNYGALVATDLVLEKGFEILLELQVPGSPRPNPIRAVVARRADRIRNSEGVMPAGLGLCFLADSKDERERIRELVKTTLTLDLLDFGYESRKKDDIAVPVFPSNESLISKGRPA